MNAVEKCLSKKTLASSYTMAEAELLVHDIGVEIWNLAIQECARHMDSDKFEHLALKQTMFALREELFSLKIKE
jgi:hypothetical protein